MTVHVAAARADTAESRVRRALGAMATRSPVVVVDQAGTGEGFLVLPADAATTNRVAFFIRHSSGLLCVALPGSECDRLRLPLMYHGASDPSRPASCVTVDAAEGVSTGISARDRARAVALLADESASEKDFTRPGHVMPVRATDGGVLRRAGMAEAAVDLARAAGRRPAGLLAAVVDAARPTDLARGPHLEDFAAEHDLELISVGDLVAFRQMCEPFVTRHAAARLPLPQGAMRALGYQELDGAEHAVLLAGEPDNADDFPVYIHQECMTGDIFGSLACICRFRLESALSTIAGEGRGAVVYLRPAAAGTVARGSLHDDEATESSAPFIAAHILRDLNVRSVRLLQDHARYRSVLQAMHLRTGIHRLAGAAIS